MNLAFNFDHPVNHFRVGGQVTSQDLRVIRAALFRFFESNPDHTSRYVVLDFSAATNIAVNQEELNQVLSEISNLALSKKVFFQVAKTKEDASKVTFSILENALNQKQTLLESKNRVKEELKNTAQKLLEENSDLKKQLEAIPLPTDTGSLSSLLDRFWSSR